MSYTYEDHKAKLQSFPSADGKMTYIDEGEGPCILLLHGVPTSSWLYRKMIPLLVAKGYRVIAPDMLGYGGSDKPKGYEIYSDSNMALRLLALMEHLGINNWTHVCHDVGGLWTWALLQKTSLKVKRLILLNTIAYQEGFHPPMRFEKGLKARLYTGLYSSGLLQGMVLNPTFKRGVIDKRIITKGVLKGYKKALKPGGNHALYYFFTQTCQEITDYSALHRSLNIPLEVIWGKEDDILVLDDMRDQLQTNLRIADKDIHHISAKHFIQEELPEAVVELICADV